jgi:hypothetical protein
MADTNKNANLHQAKRVKNDEFYTRFEDIERELKHYKEFFKGKVVYCNCDKFIKEGRSCFFEYFSLYFRVLGLKQLITSFYNPEGHGRVAFYSGELDGGIPTEDRIIELKLKGNGSFDSPECIDFMKRADIIVTNPPFSLFRKYVDTLISNNKQFIIIGNKNAITYKETFRYIKENKLWLGYTSPHKFMVNDDYEAKNIIIEDGQKYAQFGNIGWFTNVPHKKRSEELALYKHYTPERYPKYDNYDAVEVGKVSDIPCDYDGIMGVPITFLDKYSPNQFEIFGLASSAGYRKDIVGIEFIGKKDARPLIEGKNKFARIFIRRKK